MNEPRYQWQRWEHRTYLSGEPVDLAMIRPIKRGNYEATVPIEQVANLLPSLQEAKEWVVSVLQLAGRITHDEARWLLTYKRKKKTNE